MYSHSSSQMWMLISLQYSQLWHFSSLGAYGIHLYSPLCLHEFVCTRNKHVRRVFGIGSFLEIILLIAFSKIFYWIINNPQVRDKP